MCNIPTCRWGWGSLESHCERSVNRVPLAVRRQGWCDWHLAFRCRWDRARSLSGGTEGMNKRIHSHEWHWKGKFQGTWVWAVCVREMVKKVQGKPAGGIAQGGRSKTFYFRCWLELWMDKLDGDIQQEVENTPKGKWKCKLLSCVSDKIFETPWTEFSRPEYWSG